MTSKNPPNISVAVVSPTAFIKIPGRANFTSSVDFKTLVTELRARGITHFVLDLGECVTMDSTFLGVLAGLALRCLDGENNGKPSEKFEMDLVNPNERVADLLDNLGVIHLFKVLQQPTPCTAIFEPVTNDSPAPTKEEISRTCLHAHEVLMKVNPENIPKFKEVTQFLAEDLRKMTQEKPER